MRKWKTGTEFDETITFGGLYLMNYVILPYVMLKNLKIYKLNTAHSRNEDPYYCQNLQFSEHKQDNLRTRQNIQTRSTERVMFDFFTKFFNFLPFPPSSSGAPVTSCSVMFAGTKF